MGGCWGGYFVVGWGEICEIDRLLIWFWRLRMVGPSQTLDTVWDCSLVFLHYLHIYIKVACLIELVRALNRLHCCLVLYSWHRISDLDRVEHRFLGGLSAVQRLWKVRLFMRSKYLFRCMFPNSILMFAYIVLSGSGMKLWDVLVVASPLTSI